MGQYNGNQYVSKPLTIVITVAGMRLVSPFCYSHILHFLRARVIDEGARKNWLDSYSVEVFCDFVFFTFHCLFCLRQENKRMTMFPDDHLRESVSRLGEDLRCRWDEYPQTKSIIGSLSSKANTFLGLFKKNASNCWRTLILDFFVPLGS